MLPGVGWRGVEKMQTTVIEEKKIQQKGNIKRTYLRKKIKINTMNNKIEINTYS